MLSRLYDFSPDQEWTTNGHWIIKSDRLKSPARATKKVATGSITREQLLSVLYFCKSKTPCKFSGEIRLINESNPKLGNVAVFVSEYGEKVYVNYLYFQWLHGLEGQWFCGGDLDPLYIEQNGEVVAVLMPVRMYRDLL